MNKHISLLLIVTLAASVCSVAAQTTDVGALKYPPLNRLEIPEVEKITLPNGLRLYLAEDHELPTLRVGVAVNCGSYLEPSEKIGLVSILGEVLRTGGTAKWTGDQLDEMLEGIGGSVETSGDITEIDAGVWVLSEHIDLGLEVLAEVLRRPVFNQDKIDLSKVGERTAIARRNDQPRQIAAREFYKLIYGPESPYARQTEYATIDAITRDDMVAFHATWFHPEIIQMSICGDFERNDLLKKITGLFGDWERRSMAVPPPPRVEYDFTSGVYFIEKSDVNQSQIYLGHIGGLMTDPDYATRIVMNTIMGSGSGSRMFDVVRSREGLAYTATSAYSANFDIPGVFTNYAATKSESTGKAISEMINVIRSMQTQSPTEEELKYGRDSYLNSFVFQFDSPDEVVNRIMSYDYFGQTEEFLQQTRDRVERVTAEDVTAAAQKSLRPDALRILVVGKADDFDIPLDSLGLGPVQVIDVAIPSAEAWLESRQSQDTDNKGSRLLAQAVEAHGGLDRFKNIRAMTYESATSIFIGGQEMMAQVHLIRELPHKSLSVMNLMGQQIFDVTDGVTGWRTDRRSGELVALTAEELREGARERNRGLLIIFQRSADSSYSVAYDGVDTTDPALPECITLVGTDGNRLCRLGIDPKTHLLVSQWYWGKTPIGEGMVKEAFTEWADVEGVKLPAKVARTLNGQLFSTSVYTKFALNPEITPGTFDKP